MKTISEEYIRLNSEVHNQRRGYGNSANRFAKDIGLVLHQFHTMSFLDYGCGKESLIRCITNDYPYLAQRAKYGAYDPAIPHRSVKPEEQYDMVVSTDVLEHIEPEYLSAVLEEIKGYAKKGVYLNICIRPSGDILPDGRNAHLIVKDAPWWRETLSKAFEGWALEERDVLDSWRNYTAVLTPPKIQKPLNIVCFYWKGTSSRYPGWDDVDLAKIYVNNLYNGVRRNLNKDYKFILFSNDIEDGLDPHVEIRKFQPMSWTGCNPKLYVHSPDAGLEGRVLTFDLDTIIVGDLTNFAEYDGAFTTRMEPDRRRVTAGDLLGFEAGETYQLWENYKNISKYAEKYQGDEREIYKLLWKHLLYWQEEIPGQLVSYKGNVRPNQNRLPRNARIVSAHGKPRPHEINAEWIKSCWWGK
jgi:hypothetical protein